MGRLLLVWVVFFFCSSVVTEAEARVVIGMEEAQTQVEEDVGTVTLCARVVSGSLSGRTTVRVVYEDRNAHNRDDYIAAPRSLNFDSNTRRVCFDTNIVNDEDYELREDFFVNLTSSSSNTELRPHTAYVIIDDEDVVVLGWEFLFYTGFEGDRVEVCAHIKGTADLLDNLAIINLLTGDGTATRSSPQDYEQKLRPPTMEFLPQGRGPRRLCSRVRLISDGQAESSPEYFVVILSLIYTERVFITPERAYVLIYDVGYDGIIPAPTRPPFYLPTTRVSRGIPPRTNPPPTDPITKPISINVPLSATIGSTSRPAPVATVVFSTTVAKTSSPPTTLLAVLGAAVLSHCQ